MIGILSVNANLNFRLQIVIHRDNVVGQERAEVSGESMEKYKENEDQPSVQVQTNDHDWGIMQLPPAYLAVS